MQSHNTQGHELAIDTCTVLAVLLEIERSCVTLNYQTFMEDVTWIFHF